MELGITIPLQKHLNIRNLEYGMEQKLFYCWEVHRIRLQAEDTLVAVNASNRAAVVLCGMDAAGWRDFTALFVEGVRMMLEAEGYSGLQIQEYLDKAGPVTLTRTHGRRSVASLNRMDDYLWSLPAIISKDRLFQPIHCLEANRQICKMGGHEGNRLPFQCLEMDMKQ